MISSGLLVTPWCCFVLVLLTPALLCLFTLRLLIWVYSLSACSSFLLVCALWQRASSLNQKTVCDMHEQQRLLAQVKRPGVFFIDLKSHFICVSQRLNVIEHAQISWRPFVCVRVQNISVVGWDTVMTLLLPGNTHTMLYQHSGSKLVTSTFPVTSDLPGNTHTDRSGLHCNLHLFIQLLSVWTLAWETDSACYRPFCFCKSEGHTMITINLFCLLFKAHIVRKNDFPKTKPGYSFVRLTSLKIYVLVTICLLCKCLKWDFF